MEWGEGSWKECVGKEEKNEMDDVWRRGEELGSLRWGMVRKG